MARTARGIDPCCNNNVAQSSIYSADMIICYEFSGGGGVSAIGGVVCPVD